MASWDTSNPEDNDLVSQFPANERAARAAVVTNFGVDHHETDDADIGKHEVIQIVDNTSDPTIDAGDVGLWNNGGELSTRLGTGSVRFIDKFASGTRMVFVQASAPTSWSNVAGLNDRALIVDNGDGGTTGGSWTISGISVNNTTLSLSQIPSHDHGGGGNTGSTGSHSHGGSIGSNGSHSHNSATARFSRTLSTDDFANAPLRLMPPEASGLESTEEIRNFSTSSTGSHSHSLSINSAGSHNHSFNIPNEGGGNSHGHGITIGSSWRPAHVNVLVCEKD